MAKRLADFQQFIEQIDDYVKCEPDLGRPEVRAAFRAFKLDPQKPRHQRWLLLFLALIVFGQRKAGRPKKKPTTI